MRLDVEGARRGIDAHVARPLGLDAAEAAWGIHQVVTTNMELATRVVSIERGYDPRGLALAAFGGSGPVHGCRLAQALGIPRAVLPAAAGVTSAIGLLAAEVRFDLSRSYVRRLDALDPAYLARILGEMAGQGAAVVREAGVGGTLSEARSADMRYVGQGYELSVPIPDGPVDGRTAAALRGAFDRVYAHRYGYSDPKAAVELVTVAVTVIGAGPDVRLPEQLPGTRRGRRGPEAGPRGVLPGDPRLRPLRDLRSGPSPVGATIEGPAIVEEPESTTVLPPGARAEIDRWANLHRGLRRRLMPSPRAPSGAHERARPCLAHRSDHPQRHLGVAPVDHGGGRHHRAPDGPLPAGPRGPGLLRVPLRPRGPHGGPGPVQPGAHGGHVVRRQERGPGVPGRPAPAGGRGAVQQPVPRLRALPGLLHDPARLHRRRAAHRLRRQHPPPHRRGRHAAGQPGRRGGVRLLPGGPPRPAGEALEGRRGAGGRPRHHPREHAHGGVDAGRSPRPAELAARGRAPDDRARAPVRSRDGPGGDGRDHGPDRDQGARGDPEDPERRRTRSRTTWTTRGRAPRRCASR